MRGYVPIVSDTLIHTDGMLVLVGVFRSFSLNSTQKMIEIGMLVDSKSKVCLWTCKNKKPLISLKSLIAWLSTLIA